MIVLLFSLLRQRPSRPHGKVIKSPGKPGRSFTGHAENWGRPLGEPIFCFTGPAGTLACHKIGPRGACQRINLKNCPLDFGKRFWPTSNPLSARQRFQMQMQLSVMCHIARQRDGPSVAEAFVNLAAGPLVFGVNDCDTPSGAGPAIHHSGSRKRASHFDNGIHQARSSG
jgi:hypothetical protein